MDLSPEGVLEELYQFFNHPDLKQLTFKIHDGFEATIFLKLIKSLSTAESLKFSLNTGVEKSFSIRFIRDYNFFLKSFMIYKDTEHTIVCFTPDEVQEKLGYLIFIKGDKVNGYN
jgi:hypothetical protein